MDKETYDPPQAPVSGSTILTDEVENKWVEYRKDGRYPSGQDYELFFVNYNNVFTYKLRTDYTTEPETRPLTSEEVQKLSALIAAVEKEPKPADQDTSPLEGFFGTLRIFNKKEDPGAMFGPTYALEFVHEQAPTKATQELANFLVSLKKN